MAVSKRLRYEILRRDNHTCRYCGATAPTAKLEVDHVVSKALGGTDEATNLVTACEPCNNGKTSTSADSAIVAEVDQKAVLWAAARKRVTVQLSEELRQQTAVAARIKNAFVKACKDEWGVAPKVAPDWDSAITRWIQLGVPEEKIRQLALYTACRKHVTPASKWAYFAGACWAAVREIEERTQRDVIGPKPAVAPPEQEPLEDHDPAECLVEYLLREWWNEWSRTAGYRPTGKQDEDFMRGAYAALADRDDRWSHLFAAARLAGVHESTDLSQWVPEVVKDDLDLVEANALQAWLENWERWQTRTSEPPTQAERDAFEASVIRAIRADYRASAIVDTSAVAGHLQAADLGEFMSSPSDIAEMDRAYPTTWPADEPSDG